MNAGRTPEQRDADLEDEIEAAYQRTLSGRDDEAKRQAFAEMAVLIQRRSSMQVTKMELQRRLAVAK